MHKNHCDIRLSVIAIVAASWAMFAPISVQAQVSIANSPLFVTPQVNGNLMFIIDDSGSMRYEITPDDLRNLGGGFSDEVRFVFPRVDAVYATSGEYNNNVATVDDVAYNAIARSPQVNKSYYNPGVTYTPWTRHDGTLYPAAVPAAAYHNPEKTSAGSRNLTEDNTNSAVETHWQTCTSATECTSTTDSKTFWPATYFWHAGGDIWNWDNYTKVEIRSSTATYTGHGRANRTDCTAGECTYEQEIQNFANWYTYYRSRTLAARAGIGKAFARQGQEIRVGYGAINKGSTSIDGVSTGTIVRGVRPFSGSDREEFFNLLYTSAVPNSATPLRRALDDAGKYFSRTDNMGPWGKIPGTDDATAHLECRQSFTILMTDGYWSGDAASTEDARANVDNLAGPEIAAPDASTFQYAPADPYRDSYDNTLADVAMYYWKRDLRPTLANKVPTSAKDEGFWQHMTTYGVGFGVTGTIDAATAWAAVDSATAISWPDPGASEPGKLDDLLHAAINGHGGFFSAADPDAFAEELSDVLDTIVEQIEDSSASAAASSAVLQADTLLYLAGFRSTDWSGELTAYNLDTDGNPSTLAWDAEAQLRATLPANRKIFTRRSDTNVAVALGALADLSAAQQTALGLDTTGTDDNLEAARLNWLRGTDHASLRSRIHPVDGLRLLGDIVLSNPQFVSKKNFGYRFLPGTEGSTYDAFRATTAYRNRPPVLYVGANDGMLHAFHGTTGNELFAYMPSELLLPRSPSTHARINELMAPNYSHRYFVDGEAAVGDAYIGGSWKTVLVGSMGAGGKTVFALDVTDPENFGTAKVLWEFTDTADLGYNVGQPVIARVKTGTNTYAWAAIFGNGYNSTNHQAVLFIVNLSDGTLIKKISTGQGSAASPNGLASPQTTDWPVMDMSTRWIYAGDLQGRLWRFDISGTNPNNWDSNSNMKVLFQAKDGSTPANNQPITSRPIIAAHPTNAERLVVLFGTGSYFRTGDDSLTNPVQSLYGIIDYGSVTVSSRSELVQQSILWQGTQTFTLPDSTTTTVTGREISSNALTTQKGWYLDLIYGGVQEGERVISAPTFPSAINQERVRFTTLIPDSDPCGIGRRGYVMDLKLLSGSGHTSSVFDLNQDGLFNATDQSGNRVLSGIGGGSGEHLTVIRDGDSSREFLYGGKKKLGDGLGDANLIARKSWRQMR